MNQEIVKSAEDDKSSTNRQRDGANQKIILFVIGVLVGAVIATGAFLAYIKIAGVDSSNTTMQMPSGPGENGGPGSSNNNGTPPELPSGSGNNNSGTPPEMPNSSNNSQNNNSGNSQNNNPSNSNNKSS